MKRFNRGNHMRKYKNIFYYFRGPSSDKNIDKQIENNTTKAFINTLENLSINNAIKLLEQILGLELPETKQLKFSLQAIPLDVNSQKLKRALVLLPPFGMESTNERKNDVIQGRPDGWIFSDKFVILIETKTNLQSYNKNQMLDHFKNNRIGWDVNETICECHFDAIYKLLEEFYRQIQLDDKRANAKELFLIQSLITYLEEIGMNDFEGFNNRHFFSLNALNSDSSSEFEDFLFDEEYLKRYFGLFTKKVKEKLQFECVDNIYSFDSEKKRFYNHFCPTQENKHNLNINTSFLSSGLRINIWLPLYKGNDNKQKSELGKIKQSLLLETIDKYKTTKKFLADSFYDVFKNLDYTYSLSLEAVQYWRFKGSDKGSQRMQKKNSTSIVNISLGSELVIDKKGKEFIFNRDKEVYDTSTTNETYLNVSEVQLDAFFNVFNNIMWQEKIQTNDSLSNLKQFQLIIAKELPTSYLIPLSPEQQIDLVANIILDMKKIIVKINSL